MKASPRQFLIAIEQRAASGDGYGGETETWSPYMQAYAAIYYGSGSEQRQAAQEGGTQTASFEILCDDESRAISTINHRIAYDGGVWDISAHQVLRLNDGVRITATRKAQ